jgi:hypothetical protein
MKVRGTSGATPVGTTRAFDGAGLGELLDKLLLLKELQPIIKLFFTLFEKLIPPPPEVIAPAPGPIDPGRPGGPTLPQVPIDTRPIKVLTSASLTCAGVEVPQRVGGGPGVMYSDHHGMIARGDNFNYGCVAFFYGMGRDANGDEFLGQDLIDADLEFRTTYRVYKNGRLVAVMEGKGDDNPNAEGKPAHWHQSESGGVGFGSSRWLNSAGCDSRIVFYEEGSYEVEWEMAGFVAGRVPFHVS